MDDLPGDEHADDETRFWQWFFNSLSPLRDAFIGTRERLYGGPLGGLIDTVGQLSDDISDGLHSGAQRAAELAYSAILRSPGYLVAILVLVSLIAFNYANDFEQQINGDVEIYLPDGANSTELLNEVRGQWSTDIVILYIQTNNAASLGEHGTENITDAAILSQISWSSEEMSAIVTFTPRRRSLSDMFPEPPQASSALIWKGCLPVASSTRSISLSKISCPSCSVTQVSELS